MYDASSVCSARTTSTSGISGAGLKKCSPRQRSGRALPAAIAVIEIAEVLLASTARSSQMPSRAAKSSRLAPMSSTIASITSWQPASAPSSLTSVSRSSAPPPLVLAALALLDAAREPALDARARALERGVVDVAADDLAAALEQHLCDARPHLCRGRRLPRA